MIFSLNNALSIRGLQVITRAERALKSEASPEEKELVAPPASTSMNGSNLSMPKSLSANISSALSSAFTLNGLSPSAANQSPAKDVFYETHSPFDQRAQGDLPPGQTYFEKERSQATIGIGDRAPFVTNTDPPTDVNAKFPFNTLDAESTASASNEEPTQFSARKIRGAIRDVARQFVSENPNPDIDDLKEAIDSKLGDGVSDLFNVRLDDRGGGKSAVVVDQVEYDDLDLQEKDVFAAAQANAESNFSEGTETRELQGFDIREKINQLESVLGARGKAIVDQLRDDLRSTTDVQMSLENFRTAAKDIGLSDSDAYQVNRLVDELSQADTKTLSSFDQNALVDSFEITFTSNRYGPAYKPSDIATIASLMNDEDS